MRPLLLSIAFFLAACNASDIRRQEAGRFYFPTGVTHVPSSSGGAGTLYVASGNFDKRYDVGALHAVNLDAVANLPALGSVDAGAPADADSLSLEGAMVSELIIESFAGELAQFPTASGTRLFVPSRAERSLLHVVDVTPSGEMACYPPNPDDANNCIHDGAISLTDYRGNERIVKPRAEEPISVAVSPDGGVYVTHLQPANDPVGTNERPEAYLVSLSAASPEVLETPEAPNLADGGSSTFVSIGPGGAHAVAVGSRYAYVSGRFNALALRLVDRETKNRVIYGTATGSSLVTESFAAAETRGIALSSDERRLYLATRSPNALVLLDVKNAGTDQPQILATQAVTMPDGPTNIRLIERAPGQGNLVVVSCSAAGVLAIYDERAGGLVNQVEGVGEEPYGLAVVRQGNGARLFVTNYGDGRVAVVDMPDVDRPENAFVTAHLGEAQTCLTDPDEVGCSEDE